MSPEVLHLVASLPPAIDAVREYALLLARGMHPHGIRSSFAGPAEEAPEEAQRLDRYPCTTFRRGRPGDLVHALERARCGTLLLHYSGYSFARRGAPGWLVRGLERWKAGGQERRLVVMFHELWASGPLWRSSFWLSRPQRRLVGRVLALADLFLTNTEDHASRLARLAPGRRGHACLPVFSNIGEGIGAEFDTRPAAAAVFGQEGNRRRVYGRMTSFAPVLEASKIERIIDIGPGDALRGVSPPPLPVSRSGYLDPAAASRALSGCRLGLLCYPLQCLAKSGVFAAYAAHGLAPVIQAGAGGSFDGLEPGVNLISTSDPRRGERDPGAIARAAALWYRTHGLDETSVVFADAIRHAVTRRCAS